MNIMAAGAFYLVIIELDAVVKTIGPIRSAEIGVLVGQAGIGHRDRVVIGQVGADVFDSDIVGDEAIMAFSTAHQIIGAIDAQMQGCIFTVTPAIGPEDRHIDGHRAVMAGQA